MASPDQNDTSHGEFWIRHPHHHNHLHQPSHPDDESIFPTTLSPGSVLLLAAANLTSSPTSPSRNSSAYAAFLADISCQWLMKFVINTLIAGTICVVGFAGNCASYSILGRDRDMLPVARFLLRSLAVADNFFLAVAFLNFSLNSLFVYTGWDRTTFNRAAWLRSLIVTYPLIFVAQTATVWLTVLIAASRCLSVCWPQKSTVYCSLSATRLGVAGVVLFSVVYNVPRWFESQLTVTLRNVTRDGQPDVDDIIQLLWDPTLLDEEEDGTVTRGGTAAPALVHGLVRTRLGNSYAYQLVYFDTLYYVILFAIPLLLLTVFNTKLILVYRRFRRKRAALQAAHVARGRRKLADSTEQNVTLIMIVVILVFAACNIPARVVQLVWRYEMQRCMTAQFFVSELSTVFELLGSAVNFFVYVAFLRRFRQHFCGIVCPQVCRDAGFDTTGTGQTTAGESLAPGGGGGEAMTMLPTGPRHAAVLNLGDDGDGRPPHQQQQQMRQQEEALLPHHAGPGEDRLLVGYF